MTISHLLRHSLILVVLLFLSGGLNFYTSAEAIQKASLELIKNKSSNMHEPYYWADFTLNGDYR